MPAIERPMPDALIDILRQCAEAGDLLCGDAADEIERLRANQRDRREQIAADMPRWQTLPLLERLRDQGAAMKCVPLFAVQVMREAAALVESLRREVREQRKEIAGLREERRALLEADRPQVDEVRSLDEIGGDE